MFSPMKYWGWDPNAGTSPDSPNPYLPSYMQKEEKEERVTVDRALESTRYSINRNADGTLICSLVCADCGGRGKVIFDPSEIIISGFSCAKCGQIYGLTIDFMAKEHI